MLPAAGVVDLADGGAVLDVAEVQSGVQAAFGAPFGCAQVAELLSCGSEAGQRQCFSPASWHCSHPALLLGSSFLLCLFFIHFLELCGRCPTVKGLSSRPWHRLSVHVLMPQLTLLCPHTLAGTPPGGFFLTEQPASAQG